MRTLILLCLLTSVSVDAQWNPLNPVLGFRRVTDGATFTMNVGTLKLEVRDENIIHVMYSADSTIPDRRKYLVLNSAPISLHWTMRAAGDTVMLITSKLIVSVTRKDGGITFRDSGGRMLFTDGGRTLLPVTINGESVYRAEVFSNLWGSDELFFGLGSHQAGVWNYRGETVDISQDNTNISIPMLLSSKGYAIFWNNTSRCRFNNRFLNALYLTAEACDAIDYYFMYGPEFDTLVAGYRELTGDVPMFGKWAYGFWQCKNRYKTQSEITGVAKTYRSLHIPIDNIVQDWFWWYTMGEPVFDAARYPDPKGMIDELHEEHFHFMISCWPYFRPGTATYDDMNRRGFFIDRTAVAGFHPAGQALYDAFNPEARTYYWHLIDTALFQIGTDAWWLDTTEPETEGRETNIIVTDHVATGNGARYANMYPLMATTAVYEGQREATHRKRVFILSRSAYAGSQRTAAAVWSGDVNSDWISFKKQIPAGLNYSLSGLPYWTTDIGGFASGNPDDPAYRELFVRWFQFGTFNPLFRVHGTRTNDQNEVWSYGPAAGKILVHFLMLRYRLLPYIYSLAWMATHDRYTPMRALVMDFRNDVIADAIGDQFMFGPAFLVNPVTDPDVSSRSVYLPKGTWYDFWSGRSLEGGKRSEVDAPLQLLPLYIRSGSIIPMGPEIEWASERVADPIELRVYRGANGDFTLYEDEGDSYDYEQGAYATIPFHWEDRTRELTIGERRGGFPGLLESRTFRVVLVSKGHGMGSESTAKRDAVVHYLGKEISVSF